MKQEERRDAKARSTQRNLKFPSLIATLIAVVASCKAPSTPRTSDIQGQWFGRCVFACPDSVRKEEWPSDTLLLALVFDSALHGEYLGYVGNDKGYPMLRGKFSALEASDTIVFERMKLIAWRSEERRVGKEC